MFKFLYNKKIVRVIYSISEKKTFVYNYPKFFIRNIINIKEVLLDNSFEILTTLKDLKYNKIGSSITIKKTIYIHKFYKNLKFYWFNSDLNLKNKIDYILSSINIKYFIFFNKMIKGGVDCYSSGIRGVLPKQQMLYVIKKNKRTLVKSNLKNFFYLINKSYFTYFRMPVELAKFILYPKTSNNLPLKGQVNQTTIIFSFPNKTAYENKKKYKKSRKLHSKKKS